MVTAFSFAIPYTASFPVVPECPRTQAISIWHMSLAETSSTIVSSTSLLVGLREKSYLLLQKLLCHLGQSQAKDEKVYLLPYFFKNRFSSLSQKAIFLEKKFGDIDSPGYYLSDKTKTKNGPLHHHINVFSDNSVHWCIAGVVAPF